MKAREVNLDGIVGPTHNYGGLSLGNLASEKNVDSPSNPKAAARQGLEKMKAIHDLGVPQAVFPPQERPAIWMLRNLGFEGPDADVLHEVARVAPDLLVSCSSASSMWAANAATVGPSADSGDGKIHFTPANLRTNFHRALEVPFTSRVLQTFFANDLYFVHHPALPTAGPFGDEGAANHTRLTQAYDQPGVQLFVYGARATERGTPHPTRYPARQTFEASSAISRLHRLEPSRVVFAQQNPVAVDAGAFHNDVVAVGNQSVFLAHEKAFVAPNQLHEELRQKAGGAGLHFILAEEDEVSLEDAVVSYLFNSQLVTLPTGGMALVVPVESRESPGAWRFLQRVVDEYDAIERIEVIDVRQSMRNGGGPACLRLRVVLTDDELTAAHQASLFDDRLYGALTRWIERHYRDRLTPGDLRDPALLDESRAALDELTQVLELGSIYPFQGRPFVVP